MNGTTSYANFHARKLQRTLKSLREQNGLTQEEAGERAHIEYKKLSRIERRQLPTYHEFVAILDVYGIPSCDYQPYVELWERAKQRPWWREFKIVDTRYIRMEDEANRKVEFQLGQIPTLLQTEAYARKTLARQSTSMADNMVAFRMRQQLRLTAEPLLEFHALIYASVLQQEVDQAQLLRLVELAELPNVTIQIVPQAPVIMGLTSSVCLLSFDDSDEPDGAFAESAIGLLESQEPEQVRAVGHLLDDIARHATRPAKSLTQLRALSRSPRR